MLFYGVGVLLGLLFMLVLFGVIGIDGYLWVMIGLYGLIVAFFVYWLFVWWVLITTLMWIEVSYSIRAFFILVNMVWMGWWLCRWLSTKF